MATYGGKYIDDFMKPKQAYGGYEDPNDPTGQMGFDPTAGGAPSDLPGMPPEPSLPTTDPQQTAPTEAKVEQNPPATTPTVDDSGWDTDGYSKPKFTASDFGNAPSGWDQTKWGDAKHQTPKYVVGRIIQSSGDMKDPASRAKAIEQIKQAYPGTTFNGKDTVDIPGVGKVDIFGGASAGTYSTAWQPIDGVGVGAFTAPGFGASSSRSGSYSYPGLSQGASPSDAAAKYHSLLAEFMKRMQGNK